MQHRPGMRLHRHPVLRPQNLEIQSGHDGGDRGAGRLMPADLQPIAIRPQMVGVMDHPGGQPEQFLLDRREIFQLPQFRLIGRISFMRARLDAIRRPWESRNFMAGGLRTYKQYKRAAAKLLRRSRFLAALRRLRSPRRQHRWQRRSSRTGRYSAPTHSPTGGWRKLWLRQSLTTSRPPL